MRCDRIPMMRKGSYQWLSITDVRYVDITVRYQICVYHCQISDMLISDMCIPLSDIRYIDIALKYRICEYYAKILDI